MLEKHELSPILLLGLSKYNFFMVLELLSYSFIFILCISLTLYFSSCSLRDTEEEAAALRERDVENKEAV